MSPAHDTHRLAEFSQLHAAVRAWLARDFAAPGHPAFLPQNLAYADLVFAFGYARLGNADRTGQLLADATAALGPGGVPEIVLPFFRYRIGESIAGRPHAGPAVGCTVADRPDLPHNAPERLFAFAASRLRGALKTLEPDEAPDPYIDWVRLGNPIEEMVRRLLDRTQVWISAEDAAELFQELDRNAVIGDRVRTLKKLSRAAVRGDVDFRRALLRRMQTTFRILQEYPTSDLSDTGERAVAEFLCATVEVARHVPDPSAAGELTSMAVSAVCHGLCRDNVPAATRMLGECVRVGRRLGLASAIGALADRLLEQFPLSVTDASPHKLDTLRFQLVVAEAARWTDRGDMANIMTRVRAAFAQPAGGKEAQTLAAVVQAYLRAIGANTDPACPRQMRELFPSLPLISNTFTTAPFFSRLHLEIIDTAVLAFPGVY